MLRKISIYGTIGGLIVGIALSAIVLGSDEHQSQAYGMAIGYLTMLVGLSTIFIAVKRHRDVGLGGVIGFWPALGLGLGISVVASLFYVVAWETSVAVSGIDFAGTYAAGLVEQQRAKGVTGAELAAYVVEMERFKIQYADPLFRLPMTFAEIFPVGVLVSLISAALLRNRRFLALRRTSGVSA